MATVSAFTGQTTPAEPSPNPYLVESWTKQLPDSHETLNVNIGLTPSGAAATILCDASGAAPSSPDAAKEIEQLLALCADADFPGSRPTQADPWVARQATALLNDLKTLPPRRSVESATPIFGSAVYQFLASRPDPANFHITLYVFGAYPASGQD